MDIRHALLVLLTWFWSASIIEGTLCLFCENGVEDFSLCTKIGQCTGNQVCITEKYKEGDGSIRWYSGCENREVCNRLGYFSKRSLSDSDDKDGSNQQNFSPVSEAHLQDTAQLHARVRRLVRPGQNICSGCCDDEDYCNAKACGFNADVLAAGFKTCYRCEDIPSPADCDQVTQCTDQQSCFTELIYQGGSVTGYKMGCEETKMCLAFAGYIQYFTKKRAISIGPTENDPKHVSYGADKILRNDPINVLRNGSAKILGNATAASAEKRGERDTLRELKQLEKRVIDDPRALCLTCCDQNFCNRLEDCGAASQIPTPVPGPVISPTPVTALPTPSIPLVGSYTIKPSMGLQSASVSQGSSASRSPIPRPGASTLSFASASPVPLPLTNSKIPQSSATLLTPSFTHTPSPQSSVPVQPQTVPPASPLQSVSTKVAASFSISLPNPFITPMVSASAVATTHTVQIASSMQSSSVVSVANASSFPIPSSSLSTISLTQQPLHSASSSLSPSSPIPPSSFPSSSPIPPSPFPSSSPIPQSSLSLSSSISPSSLSQFSPISPPSGPPPSFPTHSSLPTPTAPINPPPSSPSPSHSVQTVQFLTPSPASPVQLSTSAAAPVTPASVYVTSQVTANVNNLLTGKPSLVTTQSSPKMAPNVTMPGGTNQTSPAGMSGSASISSSTATSRGGNGLTTATMPGGSNGLTSATMSVGSNGTPPAATSSGTNGLTPAGNMSTQAPRPSVVIEGVWCFNCYGALCGYSGYQQPVKCDRLTPFCLTSYVVQTGQALITKSCTDFATCKSKWYDTSSDNSNCDNLTVQPGQRKECNYCCVKDFCNEHTVPKLDSLFNPANFPGP